MLINNHGTTKSLRKLAWTKKKLYKHISVGKEKHCGILYSDKLNIFFNRGGSAVIFFE